MGMVTVGVPLVVGAVAVAVAVTLVGGAMDGMTLGDVGLVTEKDPGKDIADCGRALGLATVGLCCKKEQCNTCTL